MQISKLGNPAHSDLPGLSGDDHPQYLLVDGSRHQDSLIIDGNLTVSGTTVTMDTANVTIEDNIVVYNRGETTSGVLLGTAGIQIDRGLATDAQLIWDETTDRWQAGIIGSLEYIVMSPAATLEHDELAGLGDDDHTQYHTDARGDARYYLKSEVDTISGALSTEIDNDISTHTGITDAHHTRYTDEEAQDAVGNIMSGTGTITVTYDDSGNTITVSGSDVPGSHTHTENQITDLDKYTQAEVDTISGAISTATSAEIDGDISTHAGLPNVHHTRYTDEEAQDAIGTIMSGTGTVTVIYDDAGGTITISGTDQVEDHGALSGLADDDHPQYVLHVHDTGTNNFVAGNLAGAALQAGAQYNILIGANAGDSITTADSNIAIGSLALATKTTTGAGCIAIGDYAGLSCTNGNVNTIIGYSAGYYPTSGSNNVFIGSSAAQGHAGETEPDSSVIIGNGAGLNGGGGSHNVAIGYQSIVGNISAAAAADNSLIGYQSGYQLVDTGDANVMVGKQSGQTMSVGTRNVLLGYQTGNNSVSGTGNIFIGYQAGYSEMGDNKLYIDNSNTADPLIGGDFSTREITFNGNITVTGTATGNTPTVDAHFATKGYVDTQVATVSGGGGHTFESGSYAGDSTTGRQIPTTGTPIYVEVWGGTLAYKSWTSLAGLSFQIDNPSTPESNRITDMGAGYFEVSDDDANSDPNNIAATYYWWAWTE
jgi:hypothetical protein